MSEEINKLTEILKPTSHTPIVKHTVVKADEKTESTTPIKKRGRGRPKGSKNKPKTMIEAA